MKKNTLDNERQMMLFDYIQNCLSGMNYDTRGKYVSAVTCFLTKATAVGRRGYRDFCRNDADYLIHHPWAKDAICHFLNTRGIGYAKPAQKKADVAHVSLQKRENRQQQLINDFILYLENERDYSPRTLTCYTISIKLFFDFFDEFTQDNCRRFIAALESKGMSPKTIRLRITSLERFGEFLKKPVKLRRPKIQRSLSVENVPTEKEYQLLLAWLDQNNPHWAYIVRLMATTGCRVSELVQFTYEQISSGLCTLKGKGTKFRQFFFTKEMQDGAKGKQGLVCINRYGHPISTKGVATRLKDFADKSGVPRAKIHPHAFRHFFAKMYLKRTKDIVGLAEILGHGSIDITRIYLQKSQDEQKRDFNRTVNW